MGAPEKEGGEPDSYFLFTPRKRGKGKGKKTKKFEGRRPTASYDQTELATAGAPVNLKKRGGGKGVSGPSLTILTLPTMCAWRLEILSRKKKKERKKTPIARLYGRRLRPHSRQRRQAKGGGGATPIRCACRPPTTTTCLAINCGDKLEEGRGGDKIGFDVSSVLSFCFGAFSRKRGEGSRGRDHHHLLATRKTARREGK